MVLMMLNPDGMNESTASAHHRKYNIAQRNTPNE